MPRARAVAVPLAAAAAVLAVGAGVAVAQPSEDVAASPAPTAEAPVLATEAEVVDLFATWNDALQTGDAEAVADLYSDDAVLLATLSAVPRTDRAALVDYFEHDFLPKQPVGRITESHVTVDDEDTASHSGLYEFTVTGDDGGRTVVPARFTYVYEKVEGKWLIATHHSSAQPPAAAD